VSNPSTESVRFRAIWFIHKPFATAEIPATSTRLVDRLNKEQHDESLQSFRGPDLDRKEVGRRNHLPVLRQKFLPRRLTTSLRCLFDAVPLQYVRDRAPSYFVSQIGQCALNPAVSPIPILLRHQNDNFFDLGGRARPARTALPARIIFVAINRWCHRKSVAGVTIVATSAGSLRPRP